MYVAVILLTRLAGVRSFSKMSGFDFAVTVAIGSFLGFGQPVQKSTYCKWRCCAHFFVWTSDWDGGAEKPVSQPAIAR